MSRRIMFGLANIALLSAMALCSSAEARMGGHMGGGFGGGFRGGFGGPHMAGGARFVGAPRVAAGPRFGADPRFVGGARFANARFFHPGFGRFHRFHHRRIAFAIPFVVGAPYYYGDPCWVVRYTPWGVRRIYVCDGYY